jgi:hypothetical protein
MDIFEQTSLLNVKLVDTHMDPKCQTPYMITESLIYQIQVDIVDWLKS